MGQRGGEGAAACRGGFKCTALLGRASIPQSLCAAQPDCSSRHVLVHCCAMLGPALANACWPRSMPGCGLHTVPMEPWRPKQQHPVMPGGCMGARSCPVANARACAPCGAKAAMGAACCSSSSNNNTIQLACRAAVAPSTRATARHEKKTRDGNRQGCLRLRLQNSHTASPGPMAAGARTRRGSLSPPRRAGGLRPVEAAALRNLRPPPCLNMAAAARQRAGRAGPSARAPCLTPAPFISLHHQCQASWRQTSQPGHLAERPAPWPAGRPGTRRCCSSAAPAAGRGWGRPPARPPAYCHGDGSRAQRAGTCRQT